MNVRYQRSVAERLAEYGIALVLAVAALVTIFPILYVFSNSISGSRAILSGSVWLWPQDITWVGYQTVVKSTEVWRAYYNTLWYTTVGTALNVAITMMVAYPLSRRSFNGRGLLMFYIAFTMWFSGGIIPTFIIVRNLGLYATRWAMVLPTAAAAWNIIITRTYLQSNIDDSIPESAKIDGANDLTIFFRIVVPVSSTIIAVNVLFYAVGHWNAYFPALIYLPDSRPAPAADGPAPAADPAAGGGGTDGVRGDCRRHPQPLRGDHGGHAADPGRVPVPAALLHQGRDDRRAEGVSLNRNESDCAAWPIFATVGRKEHKEE